MNKSVALWSLCSFFSAALAAQDRSTEGYEDLVINTKGGLEVTTTDGEFSIVPGLLIQRTCYSD